MITLWAKRSSIVEWEQVWDTKNHLRQKGGQNLIKIQTQLLRQEQLHLHKGVVTEMYKG